MYESIMVSEVSRGSLNIILSRPISFYEYYLSQFMGYKFITTFVSTTIPILISLIFGFKIHYDRLLLSYILIFYYLILVHNMSFIISALSFFMTKVHSLTVAKNLILIFLAGDFLPLDLIPQPYASWIIALPFSASVYIPASYITGRIGLDLVLQSFFSVTIGIIATSLMGYFLWSKGLREYTGTGA
jgi:ABC-2 type transport system permease protein